LDKVDTFKDLGVQFDNKLTFEASKAKQAKQSCKKTGEGRGLYTHQMNMK